MTRARLTGLLAIGLIVMTWVLVSGAATRVSAADQRVSVKLSSTNGSSVRGRATVMRLDGLTTITVSVTEGNEAYLPYLHRGTCTAYREQPAIPLAIVTADAPSRTVVDIDFEALLSGKYVVDLHVARGDIAALTDPATSVACGVLRLAAAKPTAIPTATAVPQEPVAQAPVAGVGPLSDEQTAGSLIIVAGAIAIGSLTAGLWLRRPPVCEPARAIGRRGRGPFR